ncbi:MAG: Gfo/Idh/MocA family oxidoreductase [Terracidiphilus sp.]
MIRVGLVGFGLGGRVFHAPLISSVEGLSLSAVVERTANHAAERYPGITTYRTLEAMLADPSLNLIVVSTPSGTHFDLARQVLKAGKNVVVDKPVAVTSTEVAELMHLAAKKNLLFVPFHERRWDGDFRTLQKLLSDGALGRLVHFETNYDRWRPVTRAAWKEDPSQGGGLLLDIGTHLVDQVLILFGKPQAVGAEVLRERSGNGSDDSFTLRLRYPDLSVTLSGNCLASLARPFYYLRGAKGNYWKWGLDLQEAALSKITRINSKTWGQEPSANWGTLSVDVDGGMVTRPVETIPGDYRLYYAAVHDALLGKAPAPVAAMDAWRVARLLEWAVESSNERREIDCDWSGEPK